MSLKQILSDFRTLFIVLVIVFASSVVGDDVNKTSSDVTSTGRSRMAWLKTLFDHHDWSNLLKDASLPTACESDLRLYLSALNDGQLWASKMYDASGQYSTNILFGSEYWLGSLNECRDLQLTQYYSSTPPFPSTFYVAKINLTLDGDHLPKNRVLLVGECVPASCKAQDVTKLFVAAEATARARAVAAGLTAGFHTLAVRPVPGPYNIYADIKFHILGAAVLLTATLMAAASLYEGYLERKYRLALTLNKSNNNTCVVEGKKDEDNEYNDKEDTVRREACGVWSELLLSFSILSNGRTILSTHRPNDGALTCLHGMRFLSVVWVIMVHTYLTMFYVADNKTMRIVTERNFLYQSVGNATYCVDTFFFISGLLVTILFLRSNEKKETKNTDTNKMATNKTDINKNTNGYTNSALSVSVISQQSFCEDLLDKPKGKIYNKKEMFQITKSFLLFVLYRIVRLTPAYAFVLGLNEIALRYTHNQAVFEPAVVDDITCNLYWWRNLLYINNFYPQSEMCMVWSWYMANDTQFYVIGILILLVSVKNPKFSMISVCVVMVSSWATTIYISVWHQYKAKIQEPFEMFDSLYDKPWSRIGPYLIGMIIGWYLHKTKCQIKIPYWLVAVGWPAAIAVFGSLIFSMTNGFFEVWPTAFYVSVGHTGWGIALAWVTIACCSGYGGIVNSALSYRGLLPLSRLTYCAYLVHPVIMMHSCFLMDGPYHMENSMIITTYAGYAVMAFLSSFVISLAFEAPAVRLLKIINGGANSKSN